MRTDSTPSYLRAWLSNPLKFGAIAPSGPALAALITSEISSETGKVLELGPGKGVLTHALLDRGVSESQLILVERRPDFAAHLRQAFPMAQVESMDAVRVGSLFHFFETEPLGAVISGLPLVSMPSEKVESILSACFSLLKPDGAFYQFTYAPRPPLSQGLRARLGLETERIGRALLNIPPAAVYRITRPVISGTQ